MDRNTRRRKKQAKATGYLILIWTACCYLLTGSAALLANGDTPADLPLLHKWSGDFPVARLNLLPEGQQEARAGFIREEKTFGLVWKVFRPDEKVPEIDFRKYLVVFSRNLKFYNRTSIFKVTLKNGVADILAMETMSAMPVQEKVAMAMAVIPAGGVKYIRAGEEMIPVAGD